MEKLQNDVKKPSVYYMQAVLTGFLGLFLGVKTLSCLLYEYFVNKMLFVIKKGLIFLLLPFSSIGCLKS